MLQIILYVILAIVAIIVILGLLMPKQYELSSSIIINRPKEEVFNFVSHLKNQTQYSKWVMADPNIELTYTGVDGTVGFIAAWKSDNKNVGVGEQEITSIMPGERYDVELRFKKPFEGTNYAHTITEAVGDNQTRVTTVFDARTPFPMNVMSAIFKASLQKDMDQNNAKLKAVLEK